VHDDEVSLLAFVWVAPPFARAAAGLAGVPVGLIATACLPSSCDGNTQTRAANWHHAWPSASVI